jgi:nickel-type superoxide dismutase maturation protease
VLRLLKIRGQSLTPLYREGDYVLVSGLALRLRGLQRGDAVVFRHPRLGELIKLVERLDGEEVFVLGLDPDSVDSRHFGAISQGSLLGKVIYHIPKR